MKKIVLLLLPCLFYALFVWQYSGYKFEDEKKLVYEKLSKELTKELNTEKKFLHEIGIIDAISLAESDDIKHALKTNNRELAIKALQKISRDFQRTTSIKNLKVHIHTADTHSFVRNWKLAKFGDDLSGFRKAIVQVRITKEPYFGFEVGRMGLTLRSIVPVMDEKKFLGSLEFIQSFENIHKTFKHHNFSYLLLIDNSLMDIAKYLKDAPKVGPYTLSSKTYNKKFLDDAQKVNFKELKHDNYYISDKYFYTYESIKGVNGEHTGIHLLAMPSEILHKEISKSKEELYIAIARNTLFFFLIVGILFLLNLLYTSSRKAK